MSSSASAVPEKKDTQSPETAGAASGGGDGSQAAEPGRKDERLLDALELMGVPDDLLTIWAAEEARALGGPDRAGEIGSPPAVPDWARRICLQCVHWLTWQCSLPLEAWFAAAALFDGYVRQAQERPVALADLPVLCAALIRMQCKEDPVQRKAVKRDWSWASCAVAHSLASAGYAVDRAAPAGKHELALVEMRILQALQWRVNMPNLAKWTTAYFKRLQVFAPSALQHRVAAAWQRAVDRAFEFALLQAPSAEYPPQRLARGLLIFYSLDAGVHRAASASQDALIQGFEAVTRCPVQTLQGDCELASRVALRMGASRSAGI